MPGCSVHRRILWWYLRGLGAVLLLVFGSLWGQLAGLIGDHGLAPASDLRFATQELGWGRMLELPSLYWLFPREWTLYGIVLLGLVAGLLLIANRIPGLGVALGYVSMLSLVSVSGVFLRFQWDTLLLETLFASLLVAPWRLQPRDDVEPWPVGVWVLRLLLFRLMFFSGWVKLASEDPTWRDGTALTYHYLTQPLPNPISPTFDALPLEFHQLSVGLMFAIELLLPFLLFAGRIPRRVAGAGFLLLLGLLALTGNYGYFQILSALWVLWCFDDGVVPKTTEAEATRAKFAWILGIPWALLILVRTDLQVAEGKHLPEQVMPVLQALEPFKVVNGYGLFARMTTERMEIVFEGSEDGKTWKAYEFRYKPGALDRRPPLIPGYMPRLDWQMWFAALGGKKQQKWVLTLQKRLLEAEPAVLGLLAEDPFAGRPPKVVRAVKYRYQFSAKEAKKGERGAVWQRTPVGTVLPKRTLDEFH